MKRIYYMRHGRVAANALGLLCGGDWEDIPLDETGLAQVMARQALVTNLTNIRTVCVSPTLRTRQTAEIVCAYLDAKRIVVEDLREWRLGEWDRQPHDIVVPKGTTLMDHDPPGGESRRDFDARIAQAWDFCSQQEGDTFIISHGAAWRSLANHLLVPDFFCENGELMEVRLAPMREVIPLRPENQSLVLAH